jgi:hypothetical protein
MKGPKDRDETLELAAQQCEHLSKNVRGTSENSELIATWLKIAAHTIRLLPPCASISFSSEQAG